MPATPSTPRRPARRSILVVVALLTVSSVGTLAVIEVVLRVASGGQSTASFRELLMNDPVMGYRPRPGAQVRMITPEYDTEIRINQAGVRDDRELLPKARGERRVVILGDSMVMAVQVDTATTFAAGLEARLAASGPIRVVNAGVQGYGPVEQYLFLAHQAITFDPDLVLVVVHAGNDATDAASAEHLLVQDTGNRSARPGAVAQPTNGRFGLPLWLRRLARRSLAVQFARLRVLEILGPSAETPVRDRPIDAYMVTPPPDVERGFVVARDALRHISSLALTHGARTGVILLPASFELDAARFDALQAEYARREDGRLDRHAATRRFAEVLATLGVPYLNTLPLFQAEPDPPSLFFKGNSHLTARGHAAVTRMIATFVERAGLLEPAASAR